MAFCRNCGNKLEEGAKFCSNCGFSVNGIISRTIDNQSEITEEDETSEPLPFWQKVVYFFIPPIGAIAAIVLWAQCRISKAKSALNCTLIGIGVMAGLGIAFSLSNSEIEKEAVEIVQDESESDVDNNAPETKNEDINQEEVDKASRKEELMKKYSGDYTYSYYLGNSNQQIYFHIELKPDGSFIHGASDEGTQKYINISKVLDGYEYPDRGEWEVKETVVGPGIFMEFDGSWGSATINPENNCLEISNMNGHRFKTVLNKH